MEDRAIKNQMRHPNSASISVKGKFLYQGEEKFFLKGISYGSFAPNGRGEYFPEPSMVVQDLVLLQKLGANCLRVYTVPPLWLLDLLWEYGLRVLIGIPWAENICFLDSPVLKQQICTTIANAVKKSSGHPAVCGYLVGNEISPDIIRWYGSKRVGQFLGQLVKIVKSIAPRTLVSYANFPSTEYLQVDFIDFLAFNVYLQTPVAYHDYLSRLLNLAQDQPLVLTELGLDSLRHGNESQAQLLRTQLQDSWEMGVAGTVVFSWTDEWFKDGLPIADWHFGLVDRDRHQKLAFATVQDYYQGTLPPPLLDYPLVSVIICAYNAEATIKDCLRSLTKLNYPNYEIIVVNDGSRDRTGEIAKEFNNIILINQKNQGLATARNVGIAIAKGEIIAFTDSDCMVDPDWLTYLIAKFINTGLVAIGGVNLPPLNDQINSIPACVAVSPGRPTHVLLNDQIAEHIPGCNMAFRREALQAIGGFDPQFHAAGDDVDICWRLQDQGEQIGFAPGALVWHFCRNTVGAYLKQQRGYGKAEAFLFFKHPQRFNSFGQISWLGKIYSHTPVKLSLGKPLIYFGTFARIYENSAIGFSYLLFSLEWNFIGNVWLVYMLLLGREQWIGLLPLLLTFGCCLITAISDPRRLLIVAGLSYLGILCRSFERDRWLINQLYAAKTIPVPWLFWLRGSGKINRKMAFWTKSGLEKEKFINILRTEMYQRQYILVGEHNWDDWDLEIYWGIWSQMQIQVCMENHGESQRLFRVRINLKIPQLTAIALSGAMGLAIASMILGNFYLGMAIIFILGVTLTYILLTHRYLRMMIVQICQGVAEKLELTTLSY